MSYDTFMDSARAVREAHVKGPVPNCRLNGCQAPELHAMLASTLNVTQELLAKKESAMEPTKALWCEQGGHSFSEKDPDLQVLSISGKDKEGKPVTESRTLCGPCASQAKVNLGSARNSPPAQVLAGEEA
jgi:hypothetical protein